MIRLPHTDPPKAAEIIDGILNAFDHQAIAAIELLAILVHLKTKNTCLHCDRDLCGTR